jgi:O-antigen/teichoic acid export membrane protein
LLRVNTTLIFLLLALLIVLAPDVVPWIYGSDWRGAVEPAQVIAVAGIWTIVLAGIDAPLMAVGGPGALAIFKVAMMVSAGATAWFIAPIGTTAAAVGIAICQLVLLVGGRFFLVRRLIGVPMRESRRESAAALVCSGIPVLATLPVADVLRASLEPFPLALLMGSLGIALYAVCLRIVSPAAWDDLRTLFVRVLGARPLLPKLSNSPQWV